MGDNYRLYYLTPSGLNYYDLKDNINPIYRENPYPYFPNISFGSGSGIKIDPNGNIWTYSRNQGLHILLENTNGNFLSIPSIDPYDVPISILIEEEIFNDPVENFIDYDVNIISPQPNQKIEN